MPPFLCWQVELRRSVLSFYPFCVGTSMQHGLKQAHGYPIIPITSINIRAYKTRIVELLITILSILNKNRKHLISKADVCISTAIQEYLFLSYPLLGVGSLVCYTQIFCSCAAQLDYFSPRNSGKTYSSERNGSFLGSAWRVDLEFAHNWTGLVIELEHQIEHLKMKKNDFLVSCNAN